MISDACGNYWFQQVTVFNTSLTGPLSKDFYFNKQFKYTEEILDIAIFFNFDDNSIVLFNTVVIIFSDDIYFYESTRIEPDRRVNASARPTSVESRANKQCNYVTFPEWNERRTKQFLGSLTGRPVEDDTRDCSHVVNSTSQALNLARSEVDKDVFALRLTSWIVTIFLWQSNARISTLRALFALPLPLWWLSYYKAC